MGNVRIGQDGSIIKDDEVVGSEGKTIIREDGTIESTDIGANSESLTRVPAFNAPPVSPLAQNANNSSSVNPRSSSDSTQNGFGESQHRGAGSFQEIKEKEYDLQMLDGRINNAIPKNMIIATVVLILLGIVFSPIFILPATATGYLVFAGYSKKSELEVQREQMNQELQSLKRGR